MSADAASCASLIAAKGSCGSMSAADAASCASQIPGTMASDVVYTRALFSEALGRKYFFFVSLVSFFPIVFFLLVFSSF